MKLPSNSVMTIDEPDPPSPYKAKFSAQFMVANAILHRRVGLEAFTDQRLADPAIRDFMKKVRIVEEKRFNEGFPDKWTAEVTIETRDGRRLVGSADMPRGEWVNPVPPMVIEAKARELLGLVIASEAADALVDRLTRLELVRDTGAMLPEIRPPAPERAAAE